MGVSRRCNGTNLLNHIKQLNIEYKLNFSYDNKSSSWVACLCIFGNTYTSTHESSKAKAVINVITSVQEEIYENLKIIKE
jgi:hypothetical protein